MKMNKSDWLTKHSDATTSLLDISFELEGLANAFRATGNDIIYTTLRAISKEIYTAQKMAREAISRSITENLERSQEATKDVLKAALSGMIGYNQDTEGNHE